MIERQAQTLARWVRISANITTIAGAITFFGAITIAALLADQDFRLATLIGSAYAGMGVTALCLGFMLGRYAQKLQIVWQTREVTPLAEGAAYESGYWRVVAPFAVLWMAMMMLSLVLRIGEAPLLLEAAVRAREAALDAPELTPGMLLGYGLGLAFGLLGLVIFARTMRATATR